MENLFWDTPTPEEKQPEDMTEKELVELLDRSNDEIKAME